MIGDNEELARLRTALATTQAERDALAAEVAALRTPVTDEALVEVAAKAICSVSCPAARRDGSGCEFWDWQANELEARAVLAALRARATEAPAHAAQAGGEGGK